MEGICMIYQVEPSLSALFAGEHRSGAFWKALCVAVCGTGTEQTSMARAVLPQSQALLVVWSVLILTKLQMPPVMDCLLNKKLCLWLT